MGTVGGGKETGGPKALSEALAGRYTIEREIGEGGMATVYLAHDVRHGRNVALKLLKPEISAVLGAERFLAEIQVTAQLQHPHILPLFDSGEAAGRLFYVMPYVEGESLRARLDREKQLPVEEAVSIACDLAEALHTAHEAGVIHRDIKPANILLRNGKPLLADFGIALAVSAAGEGRLTETGLSLGTPYYMSPEQASADRAPTPATDVYSLGCVLYEMLAGEPPHGGGSAQAVLARILTSEPERVTAHRRAVPPHVEGAVLRSLEKLPADRFASARDFERALRDSSFRYGAAAGGAAARHGTGPWRTIAGGLAVTTAVLLAALLAGRGGGGEAEPVVERHRIALTTPTWEEPTPSDLRYGLAISPDGSALVYRDIPIADSTTYYLKERDQAVGTPFPAMVNVTSPVFSPDGEWIAFFSYEGGLYKAPRRGGPATLLADSTPDGARSAAWLDDGTIVFHGPDWRLDRVPENGGPDDVEPIRRDSAFGGFAGRLSPLPEGRGVLFTLCGFTPQTCGLPGVWVNDLSTGVERPLIQDALGGWYAPTGHIVYARPDGAVFAVPFDLDELVVTGGPIPLFDGVRTEAAYAAMQLSTEGHLVYLRGPNVSTPGDSYEVVRVDRSGREEALAVDLPSVPVTDIALSPDGDRLAMTLGTVEAGSIHVQPLPTGPLLRLTPDRVSQRRPVWTPDGTEILFQRTDGSEMFGQFQAIVRADGSQGDRDFLAGVPTANGRSSVQELAWSPTGDFFIYRHGGVQEGGAADLRVVTIAQGDTIDELYLGEPGADELNPSISRDGRFVAYVSNRSGTPEVYVRPYPDAEAAQVQVSTGGGGEPRWSPVGDELFYRDAEGWLVAAAFQGEPSPRIVSRERLFQVQGLYRTSTSDHKYDVAPDGERFVFIKRLEAEPVDPDAPAPPSDLILVENWFAELERLLRN